MNCRENQYFLFLLGGVRGEHFKITRPKHQVLKSTSRMQLS